MSKMSKESISYSDRNMGILPPKSLTTWKIIILILAALTPISVVMATLPLGLAYGGSASALTYVMAGIVIGLFCIGYAEMVRKITRPGAFYSYIARGLNKPIGVGAAMIAVVGYISGCIAAYASGAFVLSETISSLGLALSWQECLTGLSLFIVLMVWNRIDFSAVLGGIIVFLELLLIYALIIGLIHLHGVQAALPLKLISFDAFKYGNWHVAFIFSFLVFQGFEAGALYAPETKNPERTIPRALSISLLILTLTFFLSAWVLSSLTTPKNMMHDVQIQGIFGFVMNAIQIALGGAGVKLFSIITILSVLVCTLAVTNFMSRYLNGLSGDRILPKYLAYINQNGAPSNAAFTLISLSYFTIFGCHFFGINPYTQLTPIGFGIGAISSTALLILSSLSVIGYFKRHATVDAHWWKTLFAPALATVLLIAAIIIQLNGFNYITGIEAAWSQYLPLTIPSMFIIGIVYALWIRKKRSDIYANIAEGDSIEEVLKIRENTKTYR